MGLKKINCFVVVYALFICFLVSCNRIKEIKDKINDVQSFLEDDLRILGILAEEYGGSWNKSLDGDAYTIEITNSERLSNEDSLEFHAVEIARLLCDSLDSNQEYLRLKLISETKVGLVSSSNSKTWIEPLRMTKMFRELSVTDYLPVKDALLAFRYFNYDDEEYFEDASEILDKLALDSSKITSFYYLAASAKYNYLEDTINRNKYLSLALKLGKNNDRLLQQLGGFYFYQLENEELGLNYFEESRSLNPLSNVSLDLGNAYFFMEEYDSALACYDDFISYFPDNLVVNIEKYNMLNELGKDSAACVQLLKIIKMDSNVNVPDSLLTKCQDLYNPHFID